MLDSRAYIILLGLALLSCTSQVKQYRIAARKTNKAEAIRMGENIVKNGVEKDSYLMSIEGEAEITITLAYLYIQTGEISKAEKCIEKLENKCMHGLKYMSLKEDNIYAFEEIGLFYLSTGNFRKAEDILLYAKEYRRHHFNKKDASRYRTYMGLGTLRFIQGDYQQSTELLKTYILAVDNNRRTPGKREMIRYADAYYTLANSLYKQGSLAPALKIAKRASHLQHHRWIARVAGRDNLKVIKCQRLVAQILSAQEAQNEALQYINDAITRYKITVGLKNQDVAPLLLTQANILEQLDRNEEAKTAYNEGIEYLLRFLHSSFSSLTEYEKGNFYKEIRTAIKQYQAFGVKLILRDGADQQQDVVNNLIDWQLQTKAVILNSTNALLKQVQASNDPEIGDAYKNWVTLKNQYARFGSESETSMGSRSLVAKIDDAEKALVKLVGEITEPIVTWQDIQLRLDGDQVALEVIKSEQNDQISYVLIAIHNEGRPKALVIEDGALLEKTYRYHINTIKGRIRDDLSYAQYISPLLELSQDKNRLVMSPDGVFNLINLDVVATPSGTFIKDDLDIINVTSLKDIMEDPVELTSLDGVLIGRPKYYHEAQDTAAVNTALKRSLLRTEISDLPGTEKEVKSIASMLQDDNNTEQVLLWDEADEHTLKEMDVAPILHFATHGFFLESDNVNQDPMLSSGLLLAGAGDTSIYHQEDGILTSYEASLMNLAKTELVVLSACETGLGKSVDGEGVYGLQRAFKVADVSKIIMAMWKIDDKTTQILITSFYKHLIKTRDTHLSLKLAQQELRQTHPEPFYWGAFKIIGY